MFMATKILMIDLMTIVYDMELLTLTEILFHRFIFSMFTSRYINVNFFQNIYRYYDSRMDNEKVIHTV